MSSSGVELTAALAWVTSCVGADVVIMRELDGGSTGVILALLDSRGDRTVLRLITIEPWRRRGGELTTRESQMQRMLVDSVVAAPHSIALDAVGELCGHPAHLMTFMPGMVDTNRVEPASLDALAMLLSAIHHVTPTTVVPPYESWASEDKFVVPDWAQHPNVWKAAFGVLRSKPPEFEPTFIHRDFSLRNVLWLDAAISGVVDWGEASIGPAWLDVAHGCTNIAFDHANAAADAFADAYVARTGQVPDAYWDVMDVVGFLPPLAKREPVVDLGEHHRWLRLESRLLTIMDRI
jgi:aminoglycoside phosphotransferase (APT) family kinase protein